MKATEKFVSEEARFSQVRSMMRMSDIKLAPRDPNRPL